MSALRQVQESYSKINALQKAIGLMTWDRQVLMPPGGAAARTEHTTSLSSALHRQWLSDELRAQVDRAASDASPGSEEEAMVRAVRREIDIQSKIPMRLIEEKSRVSSNAYETWREARAKSDFTKLAPYLERLFEIAGETAESLGYTEHIYDPLIYLFEQGATQAQAQLMFDAIKSPIRELAEQAAEDDVDDAFLYGDWDTKRLVAFAGQMVSEVGFDMERGRLDLTTNAFCTNFSCNDVRLTARPSMHIGGILFSTLHEMGHGLYEQGSPNGWDRTPLAGGVSLGVHESQSRTWENIVGRSRGFWHHFLPKLKEAIPKLGAHSTDEFYRAINKVKPGPIRIGADELTYNLHILIRFELECEILTGKVPIKNLPEAWNEKYRQYLGIVPKNDGEGCLQDVHWSRGSVGYFPTYSMGNMISWQIWHRLQKDLDAEELMTGGNFKPILAWLTENVYRMGKRFSPQELLKQVTGKPFGAQDYLQGMEGKYAVAKR
jgi:carboxypeptidase Taq